MLYFKFIERVCHCNGCCIYYEWISNEHDWVGITIVGYSLWVIDIEQLDMWCNYFHLSVLLYSLIHSLHQFVLPPALSFVVIWLYINHSSGCKLQYQSNLCLYFHDSWEIWRLKFFFNLFYFVLWDMPYYYTGYLFSNVYFCFVLIFLFSIVLYIL